MNSKDFPNTHLREGRGFSLALFFCGGAML
jgi:hypothetical protein